MMKNNNAIGILLFFLLSACLSESGKAAQEDRVPGNDGWKFLAHVSDEFDGNKLDSNKWDFPQTWVPDWLWGDVKKGNVRVDSGILKLKMEYLDTIEKKQSEKLGAYEWKKVYSSMSKIFIGTVSDEKYKGEKSLRISLQRHSNHARGGVKQIKRIEQGLYNLSFWVKNPSDWISSVVSLKSMSNHAEPKTILSEKIVSSPEWTKMIFNNLEVTSESKLVELGFYVEGRGGDRMCIDEVELTSVKVGNNIIQNNNFEQKGKDQSHYRSGGIVSKKDYPGTTYVEARIKGASLHPGVCPAFWGSAETLAEHREIDYVEMQQIPNVRMNEYVFFMGWSETLYDEKPKRFPPALDRVTVDSGVDVRDDFHLYGSLITPEMAYFYFDGKLVGTSDVVRGRGYHSHRYHMFLSLGLRPPYRKSKNNPNPKSTAEGFPTEMQVDYVRVWENVGAKINPQVSPAPEALGNAGKSINMPASGVYLESNVLKSAKTLVKDLCENVVEGK